MQRASLFTRLRFSYTFATLREFLRAQSSAVRDLRQPVATLRPPAPALRRAVRG